MVFTDQAAGWTDDLSWQWTLTVMLSELQKQPIRSLFVKLTVSFKICERLVSAQTSSSMRQPEFSFSESTARRATGYPWAPSCHRKGIQPAASHSVTGQPTPSAPRRCPATTPARTFALRHGSLTRNCILLHEGASGVSFAIVPLDLRHHYLALLITLAYHSEMYFLVIFTMVSLWRT